MRPNVPKQARLVQKTWYFDFVNVFIAPNGHFVNPSPAEPGYTLSLQTV